MKKLKPNILRQYFHAFKIIQSQKHWTITTPNCDANADVGKPMFRNRPYSNFRRYSNFYSGRLTTVFNLTECFLFIFSHTEV